MPFDKRWSELTHLHHHTNTYRRHTDGRFSFFLLFKFHSRFIFWLCNAKREQHLVIDETAMIREQRVESNKNKQHLPLERKKKLKKT